MVVGNKPMFQAPSWYHPAGGGVWGFDATNSIFSNGTPEQASILKLARPIIVPVRQNFAAQADFFAIGTTSALDGLNSGATDDIKNIMYMLDGLQTRDVQ
jgi:chitinase